LYKRLFVCINSEFVSVELFKSYWLLPFILYTTEAIPFTKSFYEDAGRLY